MGNGDEGGKGFPQGGVGGRAWENNADTGFDGGGGPYMEPELMLAEGEDTLREEVGRM